MEDTIAAISSGLTGSGIGIVRISGPESIRIGNEVVRLRKGKLSDYPARTVHFGKVYEGEKEIDEVISFILKAPASYTGEDTVEIQGHGGSFVMRRILETVLSHGARPAEPGEFSKLAFLNGKLDLSQAEAVMDLINSQNEFARKVSIEQLSGSVKDCIESMRQEILSHIAFIEAALDDPEHISTDGFGEVLFKSLSSIRGRIVEMIDNYDSGRILSSGIRTAIVGRPNAGKSSLMNLLCGHDRAIVTNIAGTTRDTLEEEIRLHELSLSLVDTAGIRNTDDIIEGMGVDRAVSEAENADLILYIVDSSEGLDSNDERIVNLLQGRRAIVLLNKTDLRMKTTLDVIKQITQQPVILFSAKEGWGKEELEKCIYDMFISGNIKENQQVTITNLRHKKVLEKTLESINLVMKSIEDGMPEDFFSIDLMDAYRYLGEIIGDQVDDDVIDAVFANFCLGK